ncbi:hypothetical protein M431DRAFT_229729 [Trichoderma harzianum CBS 226.95]|uniref:Secreted protein n=1 Tax=Trichoderma harzianum CBS 226.95 TaxID=983964 RepID=A0A2T4A4D6_TRIHA|nr:hypothetical protein M431DRAFT_229729 [Trichoderma harzianum CBS 226.95]PTB51906.1 hypothetical protein M431DRAFT_229729 [Trichoderma harzianum CBS 226.95]
MSLLFFSFILSFHPRLCLLHYKTKWLEGCAFQRSLRVAIVANGIALSSARSCPRTPWPANSASMSPLHFAGEHQQIARRDATIHQRLVQSRGPSSTCTWTNHLCGCVGTGTRTGICSTLAGLGGTSIRILASPCSTRGEHPSPSRPVISLQPRYWYVRPLAPGPVLVLQALRWPEVWSH